MEVIADGIKFYGGVVPSPLSFVWSNVAQLKIRFLRVSILY